MTIPFNGIFREFFAGIGRHLTLLGQAAASYRYIGKRKQAILSEIERGVFGSFAVVMIVGVFTGMVLAFQSGRELQNYGQETSIGALVAITMCREMGPVMTAYILAGLIGSTFAAELGTMKVSEEVDALSVMSINPVNYLVLPRVIALAVISPILTIYNDIIGILGGAVISSLKLGVGFTFYFRRAMESLEIVDIYSGLFNALIFGLTIAVIGCVQGLNAENGAAGVGRSTMKSVVIAFVSILIFDFFLTWMFY